jgi:hypothetical protein
LERALETGTYRPMQGEFKSFSDPTMSRPLPFL